jgi:hypothetical protein
MVMGGTFLGAATRGDNMRTPIVLGVSLLALMGAMTPQALVLPEGTRPAADKRNAANPTPTPAAAPKSAPAAGSAPAPTAIATTPGTPTPTATPAATPTPTKCPTAVDGQSLCSVPRRKAKSYYREAYQLFANVEKEDEHNPEVPLRSGWPSDADLMPIFLTEDEASVTPSWQDYNRVTFSATFLPAGNGTTRSFILVQSKWFRSSYFSYTPSGDDQSYDLTKPPIQRRLTRALEERYWNELPGSGTSINWKSFFHDWKRLSVVLGFSPNGFQLGSTSAEKVEANQVTYLIGLAYSLNPYASIHVAESTSDGRHLRPAVGFGLDIDIISKIFGGSK